MTGAATKTKPFGKFATINEFLTKYKQAETDEMLKSISTVNVGVGAKHLHQSLANRPVAQVEATIVTVEGTATGGSDGDHYQMRIKITQIFSDDPTIAADVEDALNTGKEVFLAVRSGDSMGIMEKIDGLVTGAALKVQGEWITADKAFSHDGEKMPVLHFTHHPLGFICTPVKCYM